MKRILCLVVSVALFAGLCSCAAFKPRLKFVEAEQEGLLESQETVLEALKAFRKADPFCERPEFHRDDFTQKYRKETKTDEENDTSIDYYYDGDRLAFADYNGYGEDSYEVYLDSGAVLMCTDDEGERVDVSYTATIGDYSVSVSPADKLDEKYYYGCKALYVTVSPAKAKDIAPYTHYYVDVESGKIYIQHSRYQGDDRSWYEYYFDLETGGSSNLLYEKLSNDVQPTIAGEAALAKNASSIGADTAQIVLGSGHKFCFTEDENGEKQWYLKAPFYAIFHDKDKRDKFLRNHPEGEGGIIFGDEDSDLYYWKAEAILAISEDTDIGYGKNGLDLIEAEINDPDDYCVSIDENGHITYLERSPFVTW